MVKTKTKVICEISNQDFGLPAAANTSYQNRQAARGILIQENKVALIYLSKRNYHKLPGGGIEKDETLEQAFHREIMEETGCRCQVTDPKAMTIEHRDSLHLTQISHVFFGKVTENTGQFHFDPYEIEEGSQLKWIPIKDVASVLKADSTDDYEGRFIHKRDLTIWHYYLKVKIGR